ncbi:hypothetical protein [Actinokineospora spheciospongiae]|uniref:hypothetical protein n=1 Tax=Actinokineospora spheciospongiae TaxID=909613 RepID=UPI000D70C49A|nr:hypothetical protein [Actinokineospora spheciospongiae]PWW62586.1 hypothetical protein DFQ13_105401 [Actinokineospora spheciospongiae]
MIHNRHERVLPADPGPLLDAIAEPEGPLWPHHRWPALRLDRPLGPGARGGHGPVRYTCTAHEPGRLVEFTFDPGIGLRGTHTFTARPGRVLRHDLRARPTGAGHLTWPLAIRWLHDALIKDLLDRAATALGDPPPRPAPHSRYVRVLRAVADDGKRRD